MSYYQSVPSHRGVAYARIKAKNSSETKRTLMYRRNDTQSFMDAVFTSEDHLFVMREARKVDSSGLEGSRRKELVDFRVQVAAMKKQREDAKRQKIADDRARILRVKLITCAEDIYDTQAALTIPKIHEQLDMLRLRGVPDIKPNSTYKRKKDKQEALEKAFKCFEANPAMYPLPSNESSPHSENQIEVVDEWDVEEDRELEE